MIKSSKICTFVLYILSLFKESKLYAALMCIINAFSDAYAGSKTRRFLLGKSDIEDSAESSALYKVIAKIFGAFLNPVKKLITAMSGNAGESITGKLYYRIFGRSLQENYIFFVCFISVFIFVIPHSFWSNTFGLLFAVILIALYFIAVSISKDGLKPDENTNSVWFTVLVFGFSLVLSCFVSYDRPDSIRVLLFFITSFVLMMVIYASLTSENALHVMCGFMYYALLITALIAVAQRGLGIEADAALTDMELNEGMPGRVFSTLGNPNNYAEFMVLFMPFSMAFALNTEKGTKRNMLILGMFIPLAAILLTYSRSGWIALAIAAVIFVSLYDKKLIPIFIVLGILAIPFIPQNILNRILTIGNLEDTSSSYRVDIWTGCLKMLKEYWVTGVGLGTGGFAEIYPEYAVGESAVAPHSHMHFMEMIVELGVLGFISYICMTFTLIKRPLAAASRKVPEKTRTIAIAAAAAMTGIIMIGCFEYCWFYPRVLFAFFVCAGVTMAVYRQAKPYIKEK